MIELISRQYTAFISYRHLDNKKEGRRWASWLHTELEGYEIPGEFIGTRNARGTIVPKSLYPIFRDEEEIRGGDGLEKAIEDALENADFLVVLCSPRSRDSPYVRQEIRRFKELGKSQCIIPVLIEGQPNAGPKLADRECMPHELRFGEPDETPVPPGHPAHINWDRPSTLLGADFRPEGSISEGYTSAVAYRYALEQEQKYTKEYLDEREKAYADQHDLHKFKIVSTLVGLDLDALRDREAKRRAIEGERRAAEERHRADELRRYNRKLRLRQRLLVGTGVLLFASLLWAGWKTWSSLKSEKAQRELLVQASLAAQWNAGTFFESRNREEGIYQLGRALAFDPSNRFAAIHFWQALVHGDPQTTRLPHHVFALPQKTAGLHLSDDGSRVLAWFTTAGAQVLDARDGQLRGDIIAADRRLTDVLWAPDGRSGLANDAWGKSLVVWSVVDGRTVTSLIDPPLKADRRAWMKDGGLFACAEWNVGVHLWSWPAPSIQRRLIPNKGTITAIAVSTDGHWIATAEDGNQTDQADGFIRIYDASSLREQVALKFPNGEFQHLAFSPNGDRLAVGGPHKAVTLLDVPSGGLPVVNGDAGGGVSALHFSPDGNLFVTSFGTGKVLDVEKLEIQMQFTSPFKGDLNTTIFHPGGRWVLLTDERSGLELRRLDLQLQSSKIWLRWNAPGMGSSVVSANGRWLAALLSESTIAFWDLPIAPEASSVALAREVGTSTRLDGEWTVAEPSPFAKEIEIRHVPTGRRVSEGLRREFKWSQPYWSKDGKRVLERHEPKPPLYDDGVPMGEGPPRVVTTFVEPGLAEPWIQELVAAICGLRATDDGRQQTLSIQERLGLREGLRARLSTENRKNLGSQNREFRDPAWRRLLEWWLLPESERPSEPEI